jgi:hypothetical protein
MVFDELLSVIAPPKEPVDAHGDWGELVEQLGLSLPVDYMQFVDSFGSGSLNDFIYVFNPFATNRNLNLLYKLAQTLGALRELKKNHPALAAYRLLFEPGGLLPWGITDNGDIFCWITEGETGRWSSVLWPRHDDKTEEFKMPMTALIARLLSRRVACDLLPQDLFLGAPRFMPANTTP